MGSSSSQAALTDAVIEQQAHEIFTTTMSPYCPGLLISDCPSGKASELKVSIREDLRNGKRPDEIRNELQVRYNAALDARPATSGFGALMWIVPALLLGLGALILVRWIRSQVRNT